VGADENGGRDMFGASLSGAGRNGGTPRPLSNGWTVVAGAGRGSKSSGEAFKATGAEGSPVGKGAAFVAEIGSSGLRRLNKTLYQTERGTPAYHGVLPRNKILLRSICIKTAPDRCRQPWRTSRIDISRTCTIAAVPITGIRRFISGM
jgi:hypothetical protein